MIQCVEIPINRLWRYINNQRGYYEIGISKFESSRPFYSRITTTLASAGGKTGSLNVALRGTYSRSRYQRQIIYALTQLIPRQETEAADT